MPMRPRVFRREMKVATVKRMLAGEDISALARELKIRRTILYRWKDTYRKSGTAAFRCKRGRPPKSAPNTWRRREPRWWRVCGLSVVDHSILRLNPSTAIMLRMDAG